MPQTPPPTPATELPDGAVRLLDADGTLHEDARFSPYLQGLADETLQRMYRLMATERRVDQEGTSLQRQGQLALWVPAVGQEGAQAGALTALRDEDWIFPTYREHLLALGRGVTPGQLFELFRGTAHAGWTAADHRVQPYTLVLAAQTLHATGYAWGIARDQSDWDAERRAAEGQVVLACFGDGASSEGDVHESMVFAASYDLPVVFFCQNNQWAISVPASTQTRVPLARRAAGYGFEGVTVDGNDPLAMHAVTAWAAEQARTGAGPVMIEAHTFRSGAHTTADDPTKYRTREEEQAWAAVDPLARLAAHLRATGAAGADPDAFFADVAAEGEELARRTREAVLAMTGDALPTLDDVFETVYAEPHPLVAEELAWHRQWQAGFADAETAEGDAS
ncbi:pyruvate dehydrogenase (acetyl-transferring) E1 component subunit alpha [Citricoccus sp. SGAir0253]|uniref:thiamine pyrophosphate-dependent enzyme n=1 Tax=Citricoccus sp. SGAir0253 TaxID=2567881 RepID=UPI0010CD408D|nr:thiamine pyrophosphate-dependent enzyme [Citricoccus sp. SGAir0253]QCU77054.1 pyruvate dehydrogenase (acetyl-transferring) E1 component subunit alpha [Citricoccus sp. SGAir0253]